MMIRLPRKAGPARRARSCSRSNTGRPPRTLGCSWRSARKVAGGRLGVVGREVVKGPLAEQVDFRVPLLPGPDAEFGLGEQLVPERGDGSRIGREALHLLAADPPTVVWRRDALVLVREIRTWLRRVKRSRVVRPSAIVVVAAEPCEVLGRRRSERCLPRHLLRPAIQQDHVMDRPKAAAGVALDGGALPDDLVAEVLGTEHCV